MRDLPRSQVAEPEPDAVPQATYNPKLTGHSVPERLSG
jgi:hypothetical protein